MSEEKKLTDTISIENPKRRIVEDLKIRNKNNMQLCAGEYFGNKFTYDQTFKMFDDFKKSTNIICYPSWISDRWRRVKNGN